MQDNTIPRALRTIRTAHDLLLKEVSASTGYNENHISRIEGGYFNKYQPTRLINAYAEAFETSPFAILKFAEKLKDCKGETPIKTKRLELEFMLECLK